MSIFSNAKSNRFETADQPVQSKHVEDLQLVRRAINNETEAKRRIADRLLNTLIKPVSILARSDSEKEDYLQLSMLEIFRCLHSYRGDSSLEGWAYRIAVRTTKRHMQKKAWRSRFLSFVPARGDSKVCPRGDWSADKHLEFCLRKIIDELSPDRRTVVVLRMILGHSLKEISDITGMNKHTVRDRLYRGTKQLRKKALGDPLLRDFIISKGWT